MSVQAIRKIVAICLVALAAGWPTTGSSLWACPGCKEAVAAQDIEADSDVYNPSQLARAYNYSIYLMLSMPYLLTAFFGAACYLMLRRQSRTGQHSLRTAGPNPADQERAGETNVGPYERLS